MHGSEQPEHGDGVGHCADQPEQHLGADAHPPGALANQLQPVGDIGSLVMTQTGDPRRQIQQIGVHPAFHPLLRGALQRETHHVRDERDRQTGRR